ncbi:MAG: sulfotransferase [Hyphomicrobiaceae bacterium]|nr:sulfotransferase [Hyphomicrobiaceae bacterium]
MQQRKFREAIQLLQTGIAQAPNNIDLWLLFGLSLEGAGSHDPAYLVYKKVLELDTECVDGWLAIGRTLNATGRPEAADIAIEKCLALSRDNAEALRQRATIKFRLGECSKGLEACDAALSLKPDWEQAFYVKGMLHKSSGDMAEARAALMRAHTLKPEWVKPLYALTEITDDAGLDDLLGRLQTALAHEHADPRDKSRALFAIARVTRAQKRHDEAFAVYKQANDEIKSSFPFDKNELKAFIDETIKSFPHNIFNESAGRGSESEKPVFIVGMPRSGTSLTEQIISSHARVHGAGESPALKEIVDVLSNCSDIGVDYPRDARKLEPSALTSLAKEYLTKIEMNCPPAASRITDKLVFNFMSLGLIALLFPNASIIHCKRDAMDTCLSCYFTNFTQAKMISFAFDLDALGFYYRQYNRLMEHWDEVLPTPILHVEYEKLIADQEAESRRIIDHIGLDWDDACLKFHEQERAIITASIVQARKPIYTTSAGRWRRYEKHLAPLKDALGELSEIPTDTAT